MKSKISLAIAFVVALALISVMVFVPAQASPMLGRYVPFDYLRVVQDLDVQGTMGVDGATILGSTLAVTGNTTVGGTAAITGNTTVGGTFAVTGATVAGYKFVSPNTSPIAMTNNKIITPTASYQPLTAAAPAATGSIADGIAGQYLTLVNTSSNTITISDTGTLKLAANCALGQFDSLELVWVGTAWSSLGCVDN